MASKKTVIFIVGPTAVGKTSIAIELAIELGCEIISADSRQFYKDISIGTAKPSKEELSQAKHHFIDFLPLQELYSAGDFERDALSFLGAYFQSNNVCICTGGSGLYVSALLYGLDDLPSSESVRAELNELLVSDGIETLQNELKIIDPEHYAAMDIHNTQRLIRALEVCKVSGEQYSKLRTSSKKERPFQSVIIGLNRDREELYDRINRRVDAMLDDGLLDEVKSVMPMKHLNSLQTVGYREFFASYSGEYDMEEAVRLVKRNSRRFAKRQVTWFKRYKEIEWFNPKGFNAIVARTKDLLAK